MMSGMLETPAPFVFGGSFTDYKKEGRKFRRFTTLSSLAKAASTVDTSDASTVDTSDEPTRDEQIQQMYSEARQQGIGTVNRIDMPEGSVNIVNLVEVARYIQATLMPGNIVDEEEEEEEEEEVDQEAEEEEEELVDEFGDIEDLPLAPPEEDEVSEPLEQYEFQLEDDEPLLAPLECEGVASLPSDQESVEESSNFSTHSFIESALLDGCVQCQLLALAMPPSMQNESSVYVTLSDGVVKKALRPTLAESQAAVKTIAAPRELVPTSAIASDLLPKSAHIASKSPYRFRFMSDELGAINTMGLSSAKMLKVNHGSKSKDDGSNWIVDHSSIGSSRRPGFRTSGSSWGGGSAQLAPISQDKLRLDSLATVTVPPLAPRM
jgi:hypothetical protein